MNVLITGGAGFIGSAFVRYVISHRPADRVVTLDKLTYAGNLENLQAVTDAPRHTFVKGDVCDRRLVTSVLHDHRIDAIVHFAAESHVDRSILSADPFIETNVRGTGVLLEAARVAGVDRFLLVSTDEVYGSIDPPASAAEDAPLRPSSPYAASKAAADLLALSYVRTHDLPVVITRASNNYGPYQFPEKLIPLMILNALDRVALPMYGDGLQVRDWLHVDDHCRALESVLERGRVGEVYNVGGHSSLTNRDVIQLVLEAVGAPATLVRSVADRPGHDRRYALDSRKIAEETGFVARVPFAVGLRETVKWYMEQRDWADRVRTGEYRDYYERNYAWRTNPTPAARRCL